MVSYCFDYWFFIFNLPRLNYRINKERPMNLKLWNPYRPIRFFLKLRLLNSTEESRTRINLIFNQAIKKEKKNKLLFHTNNNIEHYCMRSKLISQCRRIKSEFFFNFLQTVRGLLKIMVLCDPKQRPELLEMCVWGREGILFCHLVFLLCFLSVSFFSFQFLLVFFVFFLSFFLSFVFSFEIK